MNDERLDNLIDAHLNGVMTDAERQELEDRLLHSAMDRARFWEMSEMHVVLHEGAQQKLSNSPPLVPVQSRVRSVRWLSWRPLTAAAAGIVFGMLCTSVVFGYVVPRAVATASRLFALVDGSFEASSGRIASGFPVNFGAWSGDAAEIVSAKAMDGEQALRFVRAEREPSLPSVGAASCDVFQLVDLRPLIAEAALGDATLELSVNFLDSRAVSGESVTFIAKLYVFSGKPDSLPADWPLPKKEALASGSGTTISSGGSVPAWQKITTKVLLPSQADFAVVHLVAHKLKQAGGTEADFGEQFADDVRLILKTQPTLPVRLAQR
jgi:hypothetical protein